MARKSAHGREHGLIENLDPGFGAGREPGRRTLTDTLSRKAAGSAGRPEEALASSERASSITLPEGLRTRLEGALDADLSGLRVHTDEHAQAAADGFGAHAFALGQDIHFGAGTYAPGTPDGDRLIAHEVAHTVQQGGEPRFQLRVSEPGDAHEQEADRFAEAFVSGGSAAVTRTGGTSVSRKRKGGHAGLELELVGRSERKVIVAAGGTEAVAATFSAASLADLPVGSIVTWSAHSPGELCGVVSKSTTGTIGEFEVTGKEAGMSYVAIRATVTGADGQTWGLQEMTVPIRINKPAAAAPHAATAPEEPWARPAGKLKLTRNWDQLANPGKAAAPREPAALDGSIEKNVPAVHDSKGESDPFAGTPFALGPDPQAAWEVFRADYATVFSSYNTAAPFVTSYWHAQKDDELDLLDFSPAKGDQSVPERAASQIVSPRDADTTTLSDVLAAPAVDGAALDQAGSKGSVKDARRETATLEQGVLTALHKVRQAWGYVTLANMKVDRVEKVFDQHAAEKRKQSADASVAVIEASKAKWVKGITAICNTASMITGAALGEGMVDSLGGMGGGALEDATGFLVGILVDPAFARQLDNGKQLCEQAESELEQAKLDILLADLAIAQKEKDLKVGDAEVSRSELLTEISKRRGAYDKLAMKVGDESGLSGTARSQLEASIAAIPAVQAVVERIQAVRGALVQPTWSALSNQAFNAAAEIHHPSADKFVRTLSWVRSLRLEFDGAFDTWGGRLAHLTSMIERMQVASSTRKGGG